MSPEENELLRRTFALSLENNEMLRGIQRHLRFNRAMTWIYWIFIIGSAIGAFYLIQPYVEQISGAYNGSRDSFNSGWIDIINNFKSQFGQ